MYVGVTANTRPSVGHKGTTHRTLPPSHTSTINYPPPLLHSANTHRRVARNLNFSLSLTNNIGTTTTFPTMCQYEAIHFNCGHVCRRLIKYCHFARNDPNHQCFGAWSIKREWRQPYENCHACVAAGLPQSSSADAYAQHQHQRRM